MGDTASKEGKIPEEGTGGGGATTDDSKVVKVTGYSFAGEPANLTLQTVSYLGKGAFGSVKKMLLKNEDTGESGFVAVKDPIGPERLNTMEKAILLVLRHENVCNLLYYWPDKMQRSHLVLEFIEGGDLFQYMKTNFVTNVGMGPYLELFSYQMWRAIAFCHSNAIIHRDLKPENILINADQGIAKLTDFGCSVLLREEDMDKDMIFYIGTLIFRAPEMILGANRYSAKSDIWSGAVVMSEMSLGQPIFFHATDAKGHLKKIVEHIGFPSEDDFEAMRVEPIPKPSHIKHKSIKKRLEKMKMEPPTDKKLLQNLLESTLVYSPLERPIAWEVLAHPFFRWLRDPNLFLSNGNPFPDLFNFTQFELASMPQSVRDNFNV